jgi:hypothetical protein
VTTIQTYVFRLLTVLEPQRAKGDPHASSPRHREAGTDWTCRQPPWMRRGSRWASLVVGWPSKPVTPPSQRRRWVRRCDYGEETCSPTLASSSRCCQWPNASVKCARRRSRTGRRRSSPWDVTRPWPRNSPRSRRRIHFESDSRRCAWWRCTDQVGKAMPRRCTETSPTGWPRSLACAGRGAPVTARTHTQAGPGAGALDFTASRRDGWSPDGIRLLPNRAVVGTHHRSPGRVLPGCRGE